MIKTNGGQPNQFARRLKNLTGSVIAARRRVRVDDVRRVRVCAYALWRDAYARDYAPFRLRHADADD